MTAPSRQRVSLQPDRSHPGLYEGYFSAAGTGPLPGRGQRGRPGGFQHHRVPGERCPAGTGRHRHAPRPPATHRRPDRRRQARHPRASRTRRPRQRAIRSPPRCARSARCGTTAWSPCCSSACWEPNGFCGEDTTCHDRRNTQSPPSSRACARCGAARSASTSAPACWRCVAGASRSSWSGWRSTGCAYLPDGGAGGDPGDPASCVSLYKAWRHGWRHLRRFDAARTALEVEKQHGGLESLLVTAVQFGKSEPPSGTSAALWDATRSKAEGAARDLEPRKIVNFQEPAWFRSASLRSWPA